MERYEMEEWRRVTVEVLGELHAILHTCLMACGIKTTVFVMTPYDL